MHDDGTQVLSRVNTSHVGKNISTKAVGNNLRHDLTLDYKFKEGTTAERVALLGEAAVLYVFVIGTSDKDILNL